MLILKVGGEAVGSAEGGTEAAVKMASDFPEERQVRRLKWCIM